MPEALAHFDDDEDYAPRPQRQRAPQRRKAAKAPEQATSMFATIRRRPGRAVLAGCAALTLVGIVANATLLQNARHPSPLFGASTPLSPPPAPVASAPLPSPRPADIAATAQAAPTPAPVNGRASAASANALTNLIRATSATTREPVVDASGPRKDQIASLLKGDAPAADRSARVAAAQRALQKVGFVVKPDGSFGATTRQAIERFERDRGLTVTGDLTARTVRELSAQSGVVIP